MTTRDPFPSLLITENEFVPQGSFAEAQAEFLSPDPEVVRELDALLAEKKIGVVAHFYMDPELQGVLSACEHPHIGISDSLKMADAAIEMVEGGAEHIVVLGVDFMSENARAMLDAASHAGVPVYRVAADPIGCSLAESADAKAYGAYLTEATRKERALHVVYINTSLRTKAQARTRSCPPSRAPRPTWSRRCCKRSRRSPTCTSTSAPTPTWGGTCASSSARSPSSTTRP